MPFDWSPLWLSLRVAGTATAGALVPGLWMAYLLATREFTGRKAATGGLALLLAAPMVILASLLLRPVWAWPAGAAAGVAAALPVIVLGARTPLQGVDRDYGNAARSLGASEWRIFWRILLPVTWRPILAATGVAFARVLAEWAIAAAL
jgi:molybdate transport system permease protein